MAKEKLINSSETIVLGGGCFWCLDATYRLVRGVVKSECGYAGGKVDNPTYEQVSTGITGHAEVVRLTFDPAVISLSTLLKIFWTLHDPTTRNRQGADVGPQYRSIVLFHDEEQKETASEEFTRAQEVWGGKALTEIEPLSVFYVAEEEHQDYFTKHPERSYCQLVISPKISKLRMQFAHLLATTSA